MTLGEREETVFLTFWKLNGFQRASVVCSAVLGTLTTIIPPS